MRCAVLFLLLPLAACDAPPPQLTERLSPEARSAAFPELVPLGPILRQTDSLLPDDPSAVGRSLEARAADLRRRAALLRDMPLS